MRRPVLLACLVLLLVPLAQAKMGAPSLAVGDFFEIRDTIGSDRSPTQNRTFRDEVQAIETITVGGASHEAVRIGTTFLADGASFESPFGNVTSTIQRWVRASDGATLRERSETTYQGRTNVDEATYDAPCVVMRYPLAVGESWNATCTKRYATTADNRTTTSAPVTENHTYRVARQERVTVPAGAFDAYVVEITNPDVTGPERVGFAWVAPEACGLVKGYFEQEGYNDTFELMRFRCAAAAGGAPVPLPPLLLVAAAGGAAVLVGRRR